MSTPSKATAGRVGRASSAVKLEAPKAPPPAPPLSEADASDGVAKPAVVVTRSRPTIKIRTGPKRASLAGSSLDISAADAPKVRHPSAEPPSHSSMDSASESASEKSGVDAAVSLVPPSAMGPKPVKSPRKLTQSSSSARSPRRKSASVDQDVVEAIGMESADERPRKKLTNTGKKKIRKKRGPEPMTVQQEISTWRAKLGDAESAAMVEQIEEMLEKLAAKEPGLISAPVQSANSSGGGAGGRRMSLTLSAGRIDERKVAALQRLCRKWLDRRAVLRSPEARAVRDRLRVWDSFIASEKTYFLTLLTMVQKCMRPMMAASSQVTEETLLEVFGVLPEIKDQSKSLLSKLRAGTNGSQWISSTGVGQLFLNEVLPAMKNYVGYVVEYPKRMQALARLLRKLPEVRAVIDKGFADGVGAAQSKTLAEMLLVPMHRMLAYEWTLQELLRLTPDDHFSRDDMLKAVMGCSQLNLMLVMQKKQAQRAQLLADAGDIHPQALSPDNLVNFGGADGRQFIREGPVYLLGVLGDADRKTLYLFNDCVAVGTLKPSGISFEDNLLLRTCELTDSEESDQAKFVFEINGQGTGEGGLGGGKKSLRISCNTLEEKKSWMNDINMAINTHTSDKQLAIATDNKGLSALDLDKVAANMRHPASGVPVKQRKRRLQVFNNAFVGSDAVDWLARNYSLPRRAAVELGQTLMCAHYFHHVAYQHLFDDKKELFEFQELGEGSPKLPAEINHAELVKKMFHPQQGVLLQQKKGRFGVKKKSVFSGADAVDWLSKNLKVQRHVALSIGEQLLDQNSYFTCLGTVDVFSDDKSLLYGLKSGTIEDLSFPTERVLKALGELKKEPSFKGSTEDLNYVMKMLTSGGNLYTSNLMAILDQDADLDQDTKKFVLSYAGDQEKHLKKNMQQRAMTSLNSSLSLSSSAASSDASQRSPLINGLLSKVCEWDFPVFQLDEESNHTALYAMGYALFVAHDLINKFNIEEKKLSRFLLAMNDGYRKTMYHNAIHASDVVQTVNFFLHSGPLEQLSDTEVFGIVLAAIIHDFDHPGVNNAYMINSRSEIAVRYNDQSVLENYHIASAYQILLKEDYNIFSNCTDEVFRDVRGVVINSVLATDFSRHFDILGQFKSKIASGGLDWEKNEDRKLVLQLALKCGDISHTTKSLETHRRWTESITEEFYTQGDKERENNLTLSPYMDRKTGNLPKSQLGFIGFLAQPLYEAWCGVFEQSGPALEGLQRNLQYWKELADAEAEAAEGEK